MGRHRSDGKHDPRSVHAILAAIEADAPPTTVPIRMDEEGRFHPPPIRWAAAGLGVLASGGLLAADVPSTAEIVVAPISQATILASAPITGEEIRTDLAALQASRAEREAAEDQAQAVQAEADRIEAERRAEEARQRAAEEAELARQKAAAEEASRESQRASQEAAERAAHVVTTPAPSEAAQDVQLTAGDPLQATVSADGPGAIVPGGRVTSGFGARWGTTHYGVDIAAPLGTPIISPIAGTVLKAGPSTGFGNAIYIEDSDGNVWVFGHMRTMRVSTGDHVNGGDTIALVGNEGQSTGPHVHIERHVGGMNGTKTDPAPYLGL